MIPCKLWCFLLSSMLVIVFAILHVADRIKSVLLVLFLQERTWPSKERPHSHHCLNMALRTTP